MPFMDTETDEQFLERVGTDPKLWAAGYFKMPHDRGDPDRLLPQLERWFANAIDAGRHEGVQTGAWAGQQAEQVSPTPPIEGKTPMHGICADDDCRHRFVVVWLPMDMETAARLMQIAACPLCGNEQIHVGSMS